MQEPQRTEIHDGLQHQSETEVPEVPIEESSDVETDVVSTQASEMSSTSQEMGSDNRTENHAV